MRELTSVTVVLGLLAVPCAGQQTGATWLIDAEFTAMAWIGNEESERQFGDVRAMEFTPDGRRLVVLDGLNFRVSVFGIDGAELASWGHQGEGPGEFRRPPRNLAVSKSGLIAVGNSGRADLFDMSGELIEIRSYRGRAVVGLTFDDQGRLLLETASPLEGGSFQLVRLTDGKVLWTSRPVPVLSPMRRMMYGVVPVIDAIGGNRIVVGHTDRYDFAVLDVETGEEAGRISRDVPIRAVTEAHKRRLIDRLGTAAEESGTFSPPSLGETTFAEAFPVAVRVYAGPPDRMLWMRRHMGVGDELAPPIEEMEDRAFPLYDLFWSEAPHNYYGTVEVPENFLLMAASSHLMAGVHTDDLGRESVRVLSVRIPRRGDARDSANRHGLTRLQAALHRSGHGDAKTAVEFVRGRDDHPPAGTRTGARTLRLDGLSARVDRARVPPQRGVQPRRVGAVHGRVPRAGILGAREHAEEADPAR